MTAARKAAALAERIGEGGPLAAGEWERIVDEFSPDLAEALAAEARRVTRGVYGNAVYARGLIEFTNVCANDCRYCGIRRSNRRLARYRLTDEDVIACAEEGFAAGFRTFVLQGGEDPALTDEHLAGLVGRLRERFPDVALTLSVGERSEESYRRLRRAGADRYLLRHETASPDHYAALHPPAMSLRRRMACLSALRGANLAVGAGFMVGSPGQTSAHLGADLAFLQRFRPDMCGIGPFVPHRATPFADQPAGSVAFTCFVLSLVRLALPEVLLPATTALEALDARGRERALSAGANVVMPNLTPAAVQPAYALYDGKPDAGGSARAQWADLSARVSALGLRLVVDRGDPKPQKEML